MCQVPFDVIGAKVDQFLQLLARLDIEVTAKSQTETDALAITQVLDYWRHPEKRPADLDPRPFFRESAGFVDFAAKIMNAEGHPCFHEMLPHLRLIASGSVIQNRASSVLDAVANKMIELYFGALAMVFASDVKLDDPDAAKGDNPDVMFTYRGQRWALALKTLHSKNPRTIFDNIKKGADQIEASAAQFGLVVVNLKNVIDHNALWPNGEEFTSEEYAKAALCEQMAAIIRSLSEIPREEWAESFGPGKKAQLPVLYVAHSVFYSQPAFGGRPYPMALKVMQADPTPDGDPVGSMKLANALNDAMQPLI